MVFDWKIKLFGCAHFAHFHITLFVLTDRYRFMRQVGYGQHEISDPGLNQVELIC